MYILLAIVALVTLLSLANDWYIVQAVVLGCLLAATLPAHVYVLTTDKISGTVKFVGEIMLIAVSAAAFLCMRYARKLEAERRQGRHPLG